MNFIYVVWAYRWASLIEHNYLVGVYDDPEIAISKANEEVSYRGGKYDCIVYKTKLNDPSRETWKDRIFYKTCEKFYDDGGKEF